MKVLIDVPDEPFDWRRVFVIERDRLALHREVCRCECGLWGHGLDPVAHWTPSA